MTSLDVTLHVFSSEFDIEEVSFCFSSDAYTIIRLINQQETGIHCQCKSTSQRQEKYPCKSAGIRCDKSFCCGTTKAQQE